MKKLYLIIFVISLALCNLSMYASDLSGVKAEYTVNFIITNTHGTPITDAVITFGPTTYLPGEYSFDVEENDYGYSVHRYGYVDQPMETITVDGPEEINVILAPIVEMSYDEANNEIDYSWNQTIGTIDTDILINGFPYNTDGGYIMLKLYDSDDNLLVFADVFEEFTIGTMNYHAGTSNRIGADFTGAQFNGNWGTRALNDNPSFGGSLRNTPLNGALFYGVMIDATVGTVGLVAPNASGSDSKTFEYSFADGVYGDFYIVVEFHVPWRPLPVGTSDYFSFSQFEDNEPYASTTINFHLDSPEEIAIQHAIDYTTLTNSTNDIEIIVGEDADFNSTVEFANFLIDLPSDMLVDGTIDFGEFLPAGSILEITNTTLSLTGTITADGLVSAYSFSDIFSAPEYLITPKSGTQEVFSISISNLPVDFSCNANVQLFMDDDFADLDNQYLLAEDIMPISVYAAPVTYQITTNIMGGTATVATAPAAIAEENDNVIVSISDIQVGKIFGMIEVWADAAQIATSEVLAGIEYTFTMPAHDVVVYVHLQDEIIEPIIIATQPQSATICSDASTTLTVDASVTTAETLTYQWFYNSEIMTDSIANTIIVSDAGSYYCQLTAGTDVLNSDVAIITIALVNPVLEANIIVCDGTTLVLNPGTFSSYLWNDDSMEPTLSTTVDGVYSVVVEDENGCTAEASSTVDFSDEITIDLGEEINICIGESATISAPISDTYLWGEEEDTQEIVVNESGWYYVTVTQGTCEANDSVEVIVNVLPAMFTFEDVFACDGTTVTIEGPSTSNTTYLWSTDETTNSIDVTITGTYTVTVSNEHGCTRSGDAYVEFNDFVYIDLSATDSIESCDGNTVILGPVDGNEWLWSDGSDESTLEVTDSDWYFVTVTVDGGCQGNDSVYVHFLALPEINLGANQAFCDGLNAELTAPESSSYLWSTGETTQTITIDTAGTYACTIIDDYGCTNSDQMSLTIYPLPIVDLGEDMIVDEDQVMIFGAQLGHPTYLWSTGATTDFIVVNAADLNLGENTISVSVTSNNECVATDEVIITVIPGAAISTEIAESYSIYPNPTSGIITINGANINNVEIYDNLGRKIISTNNTTIDISEFADGIYTITILTKDNSISTKLIKQ